MDALLRSKGMKMFLSFAMLFTLVVAFPQQTEAAGTTSFKDVTNHWAKSSIESAAKQGLIGGYADGTFKPNAQISRAEFVSILTKAVGLTAGEETPFEDMDSNWAKSSVSAAIQAGIVVPSEYGNKFEPNKPITRLEVAKMVSRSLSSLEQYQPYIGIFENLHDFDLPFTDYKGISDKDRPYVALAFGTGIIGGYADSSFGLKKTSNRAEATVMLLRLQNVKQANPESFMALKELRSVAEHGTNFFAFEDTGWTWNSKVNFAEKPINIDHYVYSATLDRAYYITPFSDYESIYERVYFKDRGNWSDKALGWYGDNDGFIVSRLKLTPKKDQSRTTTMNSIWFQNSFHPTYRIEDGSLEEKQDEKFGWISPWATKMDVYFTLKKGEVYDFIAMAEMNKESFAPTLILNAEGATKGSRTIILYPESE